MTSNYLAALPTADVLAMAHAVADRIERMVRDGIRLPYIAQERQGLLEIDRELRARGWTNARFSRV